MRVALVASAVVALEVTDTAPADPIVRLRAQYDAWRATHPCPPPSEPDGGVDDGGEAGGCGCASASRGSRATVALAVAALGLITRRRGRAAPRE